MIEINRRMVLKGLGAFVSLPYLESYAANKDKKEPSRLACFHIPGAISAGGWFPKETGLNYTPAASHKPL